MTPNAYRHPRAGVVGRLVEQLANSASIARARRAVMSRLPFLVLESEVSNVVYLTWLVDAATIAPLVPAGARLWQRDGRTPFTILSYRHGHFGPRAFGRLRRLLPSPLQSNWRFYLDGPVDGAPAVRTVLFTKNVFGSAPHAIGTRVLSDVLQSHLARRFVHVERAGEFHVAIDGGAGSAPKLACTVRRVDAPTLAPPFEATFGTWSAAVEFLACQDAAVAHIRSIGRSAFGEISLPIDLSTVVPAEPRGAVDCPTVDGWGDAAPPLCFVVPRVRFQALSERVL